METRSLTRPLLCLVTSGELSAADGAAGLHRFTDGIHRAAEAGVDLIQIREPRVDDRTLVDCVRRAVDLAAGTTARVLVNARLDVAIAAGAAGVHLRGDSMSAADARSIAPDGFLIGRSVHSTAGAIEAERGGGCDYLIFGTVYPTRSKPDAHRVAGIAGLRDVCASTRLPVLAIGGVSIERIREVAAAGAAGIAAIGMFAASGRLADTVQTARRMFDT